LATWLPIVLFVDRALPVAPFAEALAGEVECRDRVDPAEAERVVALVTATEPVGVEQAAPFDDLRLVLTCSTGTDHLDVKHLTGRGVTVANTPTYCSDEVADHALACLLAGWRGLWTLGADVRAGAWEPETMLRRFDAQRLGIVGLGRIGMRLAHRALALGIDVVGCDPVLAVGAEDVPRLPLDELLATSDAVSLHLPGRPGAPPLLGAREIGRMKAGALLVNLARASLVDVDAVVAALETGALGGAAFDVWTSEPPAADDPRLQTRGLLVTPHVGWSSPRADEAWREEAIGALRAALSADGGSLPNPRRAADYAV
jgi:D-3-phosphoglycerate dehydrogenase / 2-oxoglutarate reductase